MNHVDKIVMESEMLTNLEKVEIHHLFLEKEMGYVEIAREFDIPATLVVAIVKEVEDKKRRFQEREPVVYRKRYFNPARKKVFDKPTKKNNTMPYSHYIANTAMAEAFNKAF